MKSTTIQSQIVKKIPSSQLRKAISSFRYIDPLKFDAVLSIYRQIVGFRKEPIDTLIVYSQPHKYYVSTESSQLYYYLFSCRIKNKENHFVVSMYSPENEFGVVYFHLQRHFMISMTTPLTHYSVSFDEKELHDMLSVVFHLLLRYPIYLEKHVKDEIYIQPSQRNQFTSIINHLTEEPSVKCKNIIEAFSSLLQ
jgi:hypothetical protein